MTLIYFAIGVASMVWPAAICFGKRRLMGVQCMVSVAMMVYGLSLMFYSLLFVPRFRGEYLIIYAHIVLSLTTAPLTFSAVHVLTKGGGYGKATRFMALLSLLTMGIIGVARLTVGEEVWREWTECFEGNVWVLGREKVWRYALMQATHVWLFFGVLTTEIIFTAVLTAQRLIQFGQRLKEYYTSNQTAMLSIKTSCVAVIAISACTVVSYAVSPYWSYRPIWLATGIGFMIIVSMWVLGIATFRLNVEAELLEQKRRNIRMLPDRTAMPRRVQQYIEQERGYLNPALSIFMLAEKLHASPDDIVDAVHSIHGTSFGEYVDGLRIDHAVRMIIKDGKRSTDDEEYLMQIWHNCGYVSEQAFEQAFEGNMHVEFREWMAKQGESKSRRERARH